MGDDTSLVTDKRDMMLMSNREVRRLYNRIKENELMVFQYEKILYAGGADHLIIDKMRDIELDPNGGYRLRDNYWHHAGDLYR